MRKSIVHKKIRRIRRAHREELHEATAYLVKAIEGMEIENSDLRICVAEAAAERQQLHNELVTTAMRLAMTHGFLTAVAAAARGDPIVAVPEFDAAPIVPGIWQ